MMVLEEGVFGRTGMTSSGRWEEYEVERRSLQDQVRPQVGDEEDMPR
jgi:hypothetical protein